LKMAAQKFRHFISIEPGVRAQFILEAPSNPILAVHHVPGEFLLQGRVKRSHVAEQSRPVGDAHIEHAPGRSTRAISAIGSSGLLTCSSEWMATAKSKQSGPKGRCFTSARRSAASARATLENRGSTSNPTTAAPSSARPRYATSSPLPQPITSPADAFRPDSLTRSKFEQWHAAVETGISSAFKLALLSGSAIFAIAVSIGKRPRGLYSAIEVFERLGLAGIITAVAIRSPGPIMKL
jgi:hypothetical protein